MSAAPAHIGGAQAAAVLLGGPSGDLLGLQQGRHPTQKLELLGRLHWAGRARREADAYLEGPKLSVLDRVLQTTRRVDVQPGRVLGWAIERDWLNSGSIR